MSLPAPLAEKHARLLDELGRLGFDGALLGTRAWFAWATDGRVNRILNSSPDGVAGLLVTADGVACLTNTIEAPRFRYEELLGLDIPVLEFPWHDPTVRRRVCDDALRGRRIAADTDLFGLGLPALPAEVLPLRWALTPREQDRYRVGGRLASEAMEAACRALRPGLSEHEVAGRLAYEMHARGLNPVVTLVAADDRLERYRHPIPTEHRLRQVVMLVSCTEFGGLISNLTRLVHFGPVPTELARRHRAVCEVDAAVISATKPGKRLGDIFGVLQKAYAEQGFGSEWTLHHQGGSTGYASREVIATPASPEKVLAGQAFAWNPSITGTKSEDSVLVGPGGVVEVLTAKSAEWPGVVTRAGLERPGILEL